MDVRCRWCGEACVVVFEIDRRAVGKQDSVYVYKDWRHLPRATRVASLSGRVVPLLVILDNGKKGRLDPFECAVCTRARTNASVQLARCHAAPLSVISNQHLLARVCERVRACASVLFSFTRPRDPRPESSHFDEAIAIMLNRDKR